MSLPDPLTATYGQTSKRVAITIPGNGANGSTLLALLLAGTPAYVPATDGGILSFTIHTKQPASTTDRIEIAVADVVTAGVFATSSQVIPVGIAYNSQAAGEGASCALRTTIAGTGTALVLLNLLP
jgi:hypothetical protein